MKGNRLFPVAPRLSVAFKRRHLLFLQLALSLACLLDWPTSVTSLAILSQPIQYRPGTAGDSLPIALQLGCELMNPLGVQGERFLIASTATNPRVGWAQIRPLPQREQKIERETDDFLWDEFEEDMTIQVPVGLQSLPWTKEYREFSQAAAAKRRSRDVVRGEVGKETPTFFELSSVWVDPNYRRQGIGKSLVRRVLQRHLDNTGPLEDVYLLTLATTADWYHDNFCFKIVPTAYVPEQIAFEVQAGTLITSLIGAKLVCMQGNSAAFSPNK